MHLGCTYRVTTRLVWTTNEREVVEGLLDVPPASIQVLKKKENKKQVPFREHGEGQHLSSPITQASEMVFLSNSHMNLPCFWHKPV